MFCCRFVLTQSCLLPRTPHMFLLLHGEEFYERKLCSIHLGVGKLEASKQAWRPDLHFMFTMVEERAVGGGG